MASPRHITSNVRSQRAHRDLCCHLILGYPGNGKRVATSSAGCTPLATSVGCWRGCPMPVGEVLHRSQGKIDAAPAVCVVAGRAAEKRYERAALHSKTSSARSRSAVEV